MCPWLSPVSILTRCIDSGAFFNTIPGLFQSSPGASEGLEVSNLGARVSILTRCIAVQPDGRQEVHAVSILTRCMHRVHHRQRSTARGSGLFQSSPGASIKARGKSATTISFQSSPGACTGCIAAASVLPLPVPPFQSSPGACTGCIITFTPFVLPLTCFNPHPVHAPGASPSWRRRYLCRSCFNPHPVHAPGASWRGFRARKIIVFQSSPGACTGCITGARWP